MSGVENTTYVGGLNQANPEAQDFISQGDDHLKLIKKCLLNTFPGFSRPIDGALFPWSQTPGAISVYAKFIEQTGRVGALEAFISPLHVDGAILRANNNLSDVADPAVARANLGIPAAADVLLKSQNLNDVVDKAAARTNLGVPATADVLAKTQNLLDVQDTAIARQNLDVFSKAETFQKNLNLSDVVNAAVARSNLGAAAQADVLLKAQNFSDVPDKAVARFNLDVPSNGDLAAAIAGALVGLSAVTSVNGLIGDVLLDAADVGAEIAGTAASLDAALAASFTALFGAANGLATLNGSGVVPDTQVPSYVYANLAAFPPVGASGKIYCALDTGKLYTPVAGPAYQEVSAGLSAIATMTMLGNNTGGSAVPTALSKAAVQTLLDIGWVLQLRSASSPNATVPVHAIVATGAETNIDLGLSPKGTGATIAQTPDSTTTGGNKRGARAIDLQRSRSISTQVASGQDSVVLSGTNNTSSATRSIVPSGTNCTASGQDSFAGGDSSISYAANSFSWGYSHTNNGNSAVAMGYDHNIGVNALGAAAFGMTHNLEGRGSSALGVGARDFAMSGMHIITGENSSAEYGYRQVAKVVMKVSTTSATVAALTQNGGAVSDTNTFKYPTSTQTYVIKARISARKNAATVEMKTWEATIVLSNTGAGMVIVYNTITVLHETAGATGWVVAANLDTGAGRFYFNVTGAAATTIGWVGDLDIHFGSAGV